MTVPIVAVQVTALVGTGLLATWALRDRAAALRHLVLLTTLIAAAVVPAGTTLLPTWLTLQKNTPLAAVVEVDAPGPVQHDARPTILAKAPRRTPPIALGRWLFAIWTAGTVLCALRLAREAWALTYLRRRAAVFTDGRWSDALMTLRHQLDQRRPVTLREAPDGIPIMSWGWRRPQIVVPTSARTWDAAQIHTVLCHELAHIARHDWLRLVVVEFVRALYWWHPLVWIAVGETRLLAERACDDVVLRQQVTPTQYAEQLVGLARLTARPRSSVVTATAYTSFLERRISAMLNPNVDRAPVRRLARCLAIAPLLVVSFLVAGAFAGDDTSNGTLAGTVRPDGGQPLSDVEVVLTAAGQPEIRVHTDAGGAFALDLAPGSYRATVGVPGFKRYEATVDVPAGEQVTRDFALRLGALTQQISVAGKADGQAIRLESRPDIGTASSVVPWVPSVAALTAFRPGRTPSVSQVGVVSLPRRIDDVEAPAYPSVLRDAGVQGTVRAAGRVGPEGSVSDVRILESPHSGLSEAVANYMALMRYEPANVQGVPVATDLVLTIDFHAQR